MQQNKKSTHMKSSNALNVLIGILSVSAALLVAYFVYWKIRSAFGTGLYPAMSKQLGATIGGRDHDPERAVVSSLVRSYAVQVSTEAKSKLMRAGMSNAPSFPGTAYAKCQLDGPTDSRTNLRPKLVDIQFTGTQWLPLKPSQHSLALHDDVSKGRVKNLFIGGTIVHVWALPPEKDVPNTVLLVIADIGSASVPESTCRGSVLSPIIQPLESASIEHLVQLLTRNTGSLVNIWAF